MYNELFTMQVWSPMHASFHNGQYLTIYGLVLLLCIIDFLTVVCYGVKVFGSCAFREEYGTKRLGPGIGM